MARIRLALETESARRAASACTEADFARFDAIIRRMGEAEAAHDGYELSELDRAFHLTIFQTAALAVLEPVLTHCALHIHRFTFGNGPKGITPDNRIGLPSTVDQHRLVRDATASRDPDVAARSMRDHIETIIGYWSRTSSTPCAVPMDHWGVDNTNQSAPSSLSLVERSAKYYANLEHRLS